MVDFGVVSFIIFIAAIVSIIYLKRSQLEFQGIFAMTRTKRFKGQIDHVGSKYKRFWKAYFKIGIIVGILVMIFGTIYMISLTKDVFSGLVTPAFGLVIPYPTSEISYNSGFLMVPPWLWIIAIPFILIPHELSHGLALAANKLRIKSLGLLVVLFFIPGAFVEPDENQLKKAKKWQRLQVYCAGSFSNIVTGIILIIISFLFLAAFYAPAGVYFSLPTSVINQSEIISNSTLPNGLIELHTYNATYLTTVQILNEEKNYSKLIVFLDLPAARNNITSIAALNVTGRSHKPGILKEIGDLSVSDQKDIQAALSKYRPGNIATVKTSDGIYNITLADKNGTAYMGILSSQPSSLISLLAPANARPYEARFSLFTPLTNFILQVLNFTVAVCLGVALFNMLPMKPFDGGAVMEAITNNTVANISSVLILILLLINFGVAIFG